MTDVIGHSIWDMYVSHDPLRRDLIRRLGDAQKKALWVLMGEMTYADAPRPTAQAVELFIALAAEFEYPIPDEVQADLRSGRRTWIVTVIEEKSND